MNLKTYVIRFHFFNDDSFPSQLITVTAKSQNEACIRAERATYGKNTIITSIKLQRETNEKI